MEIIFRRLESNDERGTFDCGDNDLNDFFLNDSKIGSEQLISVTYAVEKDKELVAFFCVSNDSIRKNDTTNSGKRKLFNNVPKNKRYHSMPAVKIGRLATQKEFQRNGIGTQVLDIIKVLFTDKNKTGCRFIIVDAVNNKETLNFYIRNGFEFLNQPESSKNEHTRLMFFDLLTFKSSES